MQLSDDEGKAIAQVKIGLLDRLPIAHDEDAESKIISIVDQIIEHRRRDPYCDIAGLEADTGLLVADTFALSGAKRDEEGYG